MANIWDDKLGSLEKSSMGLGATNPDGSEKYSNIHLLLQALPYNPQDKGDIAQLGDKLGEAMTGKGTVYDSLNEDFAGRLNTALADPKVRDRIADLAKNNPAGLNQQMDKIIRDLGHIDSLTAAISTSANVNSFNAASGAALGATSGVYATQAPATPQSKPLEAFIGSLSKEQQLQFAHFAEFAQKDPLLSAAIGKLKDNKGSSATAAKTQEFLDGIQKQLKETPDLFEKLNTAFERHPQAIAKELSDLFDDPKKSGALKRTLMADGAEQWLDKHHMGFLDGIINWLFIDGGLTDLFHQMKGMFGGAATHSMVASATGAPPALISALDPDDSAAQNGVSNSKFAIGRQLLMADEAHENDGTQLTFKNADKIKPETLKELEKEVGTDGQVLEDTESNTIVVTSNKKSLPALRHATP